MELTIGNNFDLDTGLFLEIVAISTSFASRGVLISCAIINSSCHGLAFTRLNKELFVTSSADRGCLIVGLTVLLLLGVFNGHTFCLSRVKNHSSITSEAWLLFVREIVHGTAFDRFGLTCAVCFQKIAVHEVTNGRLGRGTACVAHQSAFSACTHRSVDSHEGCQ